MMPASRSMVSSNILLLQICNSTCEYWIQILFFSPCTVAKVYANTLREWLPSRIKVQSPSSTLSKPVSEKFMVLGSRSDIPKFFKIFRIFWKILKKNFEKIGHLTYQIEAEIALNWMMIISRRFDVMVELESSFCDFFQNCVGWCWGVMWPLILKRRVFCVDWSLLGITGLHERAVLGFFKISRNSDFSGWMVMFEGP